MPLATQIWVAGLQKQSLIDYPGKVACVIFLAGCNMRCHYCHNAHLFDLRANNLNWESVLGYIVANRAMLDAVVISGGEPTLDPHLRTILTALRPLGLLLKLDTNGTNPALVRELVAAGLVDYVALDVKANRRKYRAITGMDLDAVLSTITFLRQQNQVDYMFRTTLTPQLDADDLVEMGRDLIKGAKVWQLQQCRVAGAYPAAVVRKMAALVKKYVQDVVVVGL